MVSLSSTTAMPMVRQALTVFTNPFRYYTIPTILFIHKSPKRHRFSCHYTHSLSAISDPKPCIRSPEAIALEYSDLNLPHTTSEEVGHVRIRQHVNPLSSSFALAMRAEDWAKELNLRNIHYMFANATNSFKQLVSTYPGPLILVSILCPDPHFKKKHHKRRVLQKPLVDSIVNCLAPGGQQVFIQSDVLEVAVDMRNHFDAESDTLTHVINTDSSVLCDDDGWLVSNPMGIRTEREIHAELEGAKIYRRMYQKRI
ncbi:uncharacterized protein LOC141690362 isoform X4 [Apium graveolens]|uniref:uncharacterized protein LOC141690362 isoform X4 n=1 Tax=Apium graveolens TaxID=4045 RepID=UPI003D7B0F35